MPEIKKQINPDPWQSPKETWQYITMPEEDYLGSKFPAISMTKTYFYPGETYHVPPEVAAFVNERIKTFNRSCVRLLQPNVDRVALSDLARGTAVPAAPSGDRPSFADASKIHTL